MSNGYVPITITNNQSTATGTNFQQLLNINMDNYSSYLNSDLSNVYFSSDTAGANVIDSWLESGNSNTSTNTIFWVLLANGIGANSSITIYMQIDLSGASHFNNTTTGEAPQLSGTYAEYDNGTIVFVNYWNFAGTSLPSGWTGTSGYYTVNNGLSTIYFNSGEAAVSPSGLNPQTTIIDAYAYSSGYLPSGDFDQFVDFYAGSSWGASYIYTITPSGTEYRLNNYSGSNWDTGVNIATGSTSSYQVFSIWATTTASYGSMNYGTAVSDSSVDFGAFTSGTFASMPSASGYTFYYQWIRLRLVPPNATMPSISEGSIVIPDTPTIVSTTSPIYEVMTW